MLHIINFAHGAQYMMGAFIAWMALTYFQINFWWALLLAPLIVGLFAAVLEKLLISRIAGQDPLYSLMLTFGLGLMIQGPFREIYGSTGKRYLAPAQLAGGQDLGFVFVPNYRLWVIAASAAACFITWFVIEKTKLGSYLRAATENRTLVETFGINVSRMVTVTYAFGAGLAAFAGVLAAPIYSVNPNMGADTLATIFAVVVIGGMGSILGAIVTGFGLGILEAMTKVFYPEASSIVIFIMMVVILLVKPAGLFGRGDFSSSTHKSTSTPAPLPGVSTNLAIVCRASRGDRRRAHAILPDLFDEAVVLRSLGSVIQPSARLRRLAVFGHAAYFGLASYVTAYAAKNWGLTPELAILAGIAAGGALGLIFGAIAIRRQGIYFSMITLALAEMVYFMSVQWTSFTGGDDGIQDVPRGRLFGLFSLDNDVTLNMFVGVVFLAGLAVIVRIINSPFGQVLEAIRDNEPRALSLGYSVNLYKLALFTLSACLAGLAGGLKVVVFQVASLTDVHWSTSGEIVLMTLVGGIGTITGPIVGAAVMIAIENYLAVMGGWMTVLQGAIFVACVLTFRQGIVGFMTRLPIIWRRTRPAPAVPADRQPSKGPRDWPCDGLDYDSPCKVDRGL